MICVVLCFVRVSLSRAEIGLPFFSSAQKIQKLCAEASLCSLTFRFSGFIQSSVYYVNSSPSSMFLSSRHPVICKYQAVHTSSEISSFCVCWRFIGSFLPFFFLLSDSILDPSLLSFWHLNSRHTQEGPIWGIEGRQQKESSNNISDSHHHRRCTGLMMRWRPDDEPTASCKEIPLTSLPEESLSSQSCWCDR